MEAEFDTILATLQPSKQLFDIASKMFANIWNHQRKQGSAIVHSMKKELITVERQI